MWIVKLSDNRKHSAWLNKKDALRQAEVLEEHGYIKVDRSVNGLKDFVEFDETVVCEDGYYYV